MGTLESDMDKGLTFPRRRLLFLLYGIVITPPLFYFDSVAFNAHHHGQWFVNVVVSIHFIILFLDATPRLKKLLVLMVIYGTFAEILGTMVLKLYVYRLDNIPFYVPLGHALIFALVYHLRRLLAFQGLSRRVEPFLYFFSAVICYFSLLLANDVFGGVCYTFYLLILSTKKNKLFYLIMFYMVFYLEMTGTLLRVWSWYSIFNGPFYDLPVGNPPAGIAGLYMIMDMFACTSYWLITKKWALSFKQPKLQINQPR